MRHLVRLSNLVMKTREAMVTKITLDARLQKLVERLPSQGLALNHARLILLHDGFTQGCRRISFTNNFTK